MEKYFKQIIQALGEDPEREGLKDTPKRAAKALEFLTQGYHQSIDKIVNGALFQSDNDEMVLVKNIELYSLCEHHLLPFIGKCHVAYVPNGKIIGLSKIARIVDMHARRLQVQENLTKEIAQTVLQVTQAKGVGIIIEAQHLCMMMRGVEKQNSIMSTSVMLGLLRDDSRSRAEFLSLVRNNDRLL
ncbi:MAG: GTP cyclohydrolase I FolE [Gammaproteobacteria bacterium RIFCSPHIGHO2_12_FULL_37_14]|nr:MAG: GTP cyclohydrolase I FolE [Gammaproteobacteria bacterium RIFCSPHIGHO2_12_FULL_37_14]